MQALLSVADDVSRLLTDAREKAGRDTARAVAAELPGAIDRLVLIRWRRLIIMMLLGGAALWALGLVGGYVLRGAGPALQCSAVQPNGMRVCWRWEAGPPKI